MSRSLCAGAIGILFAGAATTAAADGPPPLTPPALTAPATTAAEAPRPAPAAATPPIPESRPVLVIPGVTAPPRVRSRPPAASSPGAELATPRELPALDVPQNAVEPAPREIPRLRPSAGPPTVIESVPGERVAVPPSYRSARPVQTPAAVQPHTARAPATPAPQPARRPPGLFGRFFAPPVPAPRNTGAARSGVTVEPRSDPAADATLQRRIERQVRDAVGDRVRSYEVRVVDRNVSVRARVSRFWQKRAVKRTLESLPGLNGYHARVEVVE